MMDRFPIRAVLADEDGSRHYVRLHRSVEALCEFQGRVYCRSLEEATVGGWQVFREARTA